MICCRQLASASTHSLKQPASRGNKRRLEVSPLAEDTRRVSRRLNPEPDSTAPRTRSAAHNANQQQRDASTALKPAETAHALLQSVPDTGKSAGGSRREVQQTKGKHASAQTRRASAPRCTGSAVMHTDARETDFLAASGIVDAPVAAATDVSGKLVSSKQRDQSVCKNNSRAAASLRDRPAAVSGQDSLVPRSGQGRPAAINQVADRIARSSARLGRLIHNSVKVGKAIAKPASRGKTAQIEKTSINPALAAASAAAKGAEVAAGAEAEPTALGPSQPRSTAVSGVSLKLLQEAAVAGQLGCPKCR